MKTSPLPAWIRTAQNADYALEHSGSLLFLYTLFLGSHILDSPAYARFAFAVTLLACLVPKTVMRCFARCRPGHR